MFLHDHLEHSRLAGTEIKHFERQGRLRLALAASQCVHLPCACGRDGGVRELMLQKASPSHRRLAWWRYAAHMILVDTVSLPRINLGVRVIRTAEMVISAGDVNLDQGD